MKFSSENDNLGKRRLSQKLPFLRKVSWFREERSLFNEE
jgi:hypothetical protein